MRECSAISAGPPLELLDRQLLQEFDRVVIDAPPEHRLELAETNQSRRAARPTTSSEPVREAYRRVAIDPLLGPLIDVRRAGQDTITVSPEIRRRRAARTSDVPKKRKTQYGPCEGPCQDRAVRTTRAHSKNRPKVCANRNGRSAYPGRAGMRKKDSRAPEVPASGKGSEKRERPGKSEPHEHLPRGLPNSPPVFPAGKSPCPLSPRGQSGWCLTCGAGVWAWPLSSAERS